MNTLPTLSELALLVKVITEVMALRHTTVVVVQVAVAVVQVA
jgi:hypothetical protein